MEAGLISFFVLAADPAWLVEQEDEQMGFVNHITLKMIHHLESCHAALDFLVAKEWKNKQEKLHQITYHPTKYFNQI